MKTPPEIKPADAAQDTPATPKPKYEPPSVTPAGRVEQITLAPKSCEFLPPNNPHRC